MKKTTTHPLRTRAEKRQLRNILCIFAGVILLGVMLFEQATDINFYFGGAINKNNVELGITEKRKEEVAEQLVEHLRNAGKNVNIAFWAI